jgi:hypothetical protein
MTLPPQSLPVTRALRVGADADDIAMMQREDGVLASQSRCAGLTGPAQSLCYAALYGVSV